MSQGALHDVVVADFSRILAGPMATMTLGDLGATVIKVESPAGDETRRWGPPFMDNGDATYFQAINRNKRSIALDLSQAADREIAGRLVAAADVLVHNFKPGAMERFGLGYDEVSTLNPRLVYCAISGFGNGAGADLPGFDPLVQAVGGLMSVTGAEGGEPAKVGVAVVDVIAGLYAATGVLAALRARETTGRGQRVDVTLLGAVLAALSNQASAYLNAGAIPRALGTRHPNIEPFATFATADGPLMICAGTDGQFQRLATAIGAPELLDDERFAGNRARVAHHEELRAAIEARLAARSAAEWTPLLEAAGVPAGPVNDMAQAFALAERLELGSVDEHDGVRTVASPIGLSETPAVTRSAPPDHDADRAEVLAWLDR